MFITNFFQKIKWEVLARLNPLYYIYSDVKDRDERKFRKSGYFDTKKFILSDKILKREFDFKQSTALEIGCGSGRMTEFLAKNFKKVIGVDISSGMIRLAKERLKKLTNIEYLVSDGTHLNLQDETIDFVFSFIVFQHFSTKKMVWENFKEIHRVLKKGGGCC